MSNVYPETFNERDVLTLKINQNLKKRARSNKILKRRLAVFRTYPVFWVGFSRRFDSGVIFKGRCVRRSSGPNVPHLALNLGTRFLFNAAHGRRCAKRLAGVRYEYPGNRRRLENDQLYRRTLYRLPSKTYACERYVMQLCTRSTHVCTPLPPPPQARAPRQRVYARYVTSGPLLRILTSYIKLADRT